MMKLLAILLLAGCAGESKPPPKSPTTEPATPTTAQPASIGSAYMKDDGTIQLMLRAEGDGAIGDAMFLYPPDHPEYAEILAHLGGLKPGESKPVPPWPDKK
jgi:hypothetical protein